VKTSNLTLKKLGEILDSQGDGYECRRLFWYVAPCGLVLLDVAEELTVPIFRCREMKEKSGRNSLQDATSQKTAIFI
jgi:hypothetical protein